MCQKQVSVLATNIYVLKMSKHSWCEIPDPHAGLSSLDHINEAVLESKHKWTCGWEPEEELQQHLELFTLH